MAFSDDGRPVSSSLTMRNALNYAKNFGALLICHEEDLDLLEEGVMNQGAVSVACGLKGIPASAEEIMLIRDIILARELHTKVHIAHVSTALGVELVRFGKGLGVEVTAETCPQYFSLTEDEILNQGTLARVNPPLRTRADVEALREGLREGIMDAISTDHAPHTAEEKARDLTKAPFGIVGMETAAALTYTELVLGGYLTPCQMAEKMSANPARILGIDKGDISPGKRADVVVFDPRVSYEIHGADFAGKAKNMPYEGREVTGQVAVTICGGKVTYRRKTND